ISEEFHRITSKDLVGTFGAAFDKHVPCLLKLYRARKGAFGQKMEDLLEKLDEKDTDHEERLLRGVSVAILTVIEDDDAAISPNVRDVAVVYLKNFIGSPAKTSWGQFGAAFDKCALPAETVPG
ncbi:hypothetical protein JOQ06_017642, partial [Pogonophryne albipinna]